MTFVPVGGPDSQSRHTPHNSPLGAEQLAPANLRSLIERIGTMAERSGRDDLADRLVNSLKRLEDGHVRVVVVGEFKQGKSKLINALVNAPVCPIDDDIATTIPTVVGYGEEPNAVVLSRTGARGELVDRIEVALEDLPQLVSESGNPGNVRNLVAAEVALPREILRGGLLLVDTPGVGGLDSSHALATLSSLSAASAVILVSDASQEYTEPEMQLLRYAQRISPNVSTVLAKTDLYPDWRVIEEINRGHLARGAGLENGESALGPEVPLFAVSSDLRLLAAESQDADLNEESGFPALVNHLRSEVLERAEALALRSAVHDLHFVVDQMIFSARSELSALMNPADTPRLVSELEYAQTRAEEFRSRTSKWNVRLGDGIADLTADMEHDLRDRLRRIQRELEAAIDDGDPGPIWPQITAWLDDRVASAISDTFVWTEERSRWLTEEVGTVFAAGEMELPQIYVGDTDGVLNAVEQLPTYQPGRLSATEKIYIGVRGSYGGVLMVGLATGLIGLSLINPLSLLAGVLVGRRAYREDISNRLQRRRFEAKNIVRRHIDEVTFQVSKELRERLRLVQRTDRDYFGGIADEMYRSLTEAVLAAKQAVGVFTSERDQRAAGLRQRLAQLDAMKADLPDLGALPAGGSLRHGSAPVRPKVAP